MKKISVVLLGLLGGIFICVLSALLMYNVKRYAGEAPVSSAAESYNGGFMLTFHQGFVAIKQIGEVSPYKVYNIPESMLSEYDKKLLSDGLYFVSLEEAMRTAEDFVG